ASPCLPHALSSSRAKYPTLQAYRKRLKKVWEASSRAYATAISIEAGSPCCNVLSNRGMRGAASQAVCPPVRFGAGRFLLDCGETGLLAGTQESVSNKPIYEVFAASWRSLCTQRSPTIPR